MELTITEREHQRLLRNGYMYLHRNSLSEGSSIWECIYRRKGYQCNAKVKLLPLDEFLDEIHEHSHTPSQAECQVTKVKVGIKRRAEEIEEITQQTLGTELRNISNHFTENHIFLFKRS